MRTNTDNVVNLEAHFNRLRAAVAKWTSLTDEEWQIFSGIFRIKTVERGEYLIRPGSRTHQLYFICQGLLRIYYVSENGNEANKSFIAEGTLGGPLAASALNLPVLYGMQAMEPAVLLTAEYRDFAALLDRHPVFDRLGRQMAERILIHKELRERSLLQQSAKERYLDFLQHYAELLDRIPQYQIASYLGITEVSLSRIRASLPARRS